jgi:hypothetical protein
VIPRAHEIDGVGLLIAIGFSVFRRGSGYQESAHEGEFSASNPLLCFHPSIADINFLCRIFFSCKLASDYLCGGRPQRGAGGVLRARNQRCAATRFFIAEDEMFALLAKIHME